jgi:hypothetical protein
VLLNFFDARCFLCLYKTDWKFFIRMKINILLGEIFLYCPNLLLNLQNFEVTGNEVLPNFGSARVLLGLNRQVETRIDEVYHWARYSLPCLLWRDTEFRKGHRKWSVAKLMQVLLMLVRDMWKFVYIRMMKINIPLGEIPPTIIYCGRFYKFRKSGK